MRQRENKSSAGKGWGPFTSRQLTTIVCVAIIAAVLIPTAAMAAVGKFTSTTATPAVTGTNSATVANAKGVQGSASATSAGVTRYGVTGNAGGTFGIGVQGTGTKYGVFSNGPLGVASGKSLSCTGCVGPAALSTAAKSPQILTTGQSESGVFAAVGNAANDLMTDGITFSRPLNAGYHTVYTGTWPVDHCATPGSSDPGYVCIYLRLNNQTNFLGVGYLGNDAATVIHGMTMRWSATDVLARAEGTWTITAP
jgi:hypothetical protein